jgi:hypothetical protein
MRLFGTKEGHLPLEIDESGLPGFKLLPEGFERLREFGDRQLFLLVAVWRADEVLDCRA